MIDSCPHCQNVEKLDSEQAGKSAWIFLAGVLFGTMIILNIYYNILNQNNYYNHYSIKSPFFHNTTHLLNLYLP